MPPNSEDAYKAFRIYEGDFQRTRREVEDELTDADIFSQLDDILRRGCPFLCPTDGSRGCACLVVPAGAEIVRCPKCGMDHEGGWPTRPLQANNAHSAKDDTQRLALQAELEQHREAEKERRLKTQELEVNSGFCVRAWARVSACVCVGSGQELCTRDPT